MFQCLISNISMWFSVYHIILFHTVTIGVCYDSQSVQLSMCTNSNSDEIVVFYWTTLEVCYDRCHSRNECKSIMYQDRMRRCSLKRTEHVPTNAINTINRLCAYIVMSKSESGMKNSCDSHGCAVGEMCVPIETADPMYKCVKSECPDAPDVLDATVLSTKRDVLSTTAYKCTGGFRPIGRTQIQCQSNGTWTMPSFTCRRTCALPQIHLANADLTRVENHDNGYITGTTLHYTCREQYSWSGPTATSTCSTRGKWTPAYVNCCRYPNTLLGNRCIQVHNSSSADNNTVASNACSASGGGTLVGHVNSVTSYVAGNKPQCTWLLLDDKKDNFMYINNITRCFEIYDALSMYPGTYDEAVQLVKENGFVNGTCSSAYKWADGEPNGNSTENCMYQNLRSSSILEYYDDSCYFGSLNNTCIVCRDWLHEI